MAEIQVTAASIRNKAQELQSLNSTFKSYVEDMISTENSLGAMWEGEAKNAFHTAFTTDTQKMSEFYNLIEKYCQALETIAEEYEKAEAANTATATQRSY